MKLAIDAMGGDHAPEQIVKGAIRAAGEFKDLELMLVGDSKQIEPFLTDTADGRIEVLHTEEMIKSTDQPVRAVRKKKDASMVLAVDQVKKGECEAVISAGNTGALMTAGLFGVGRIKGIDRPALAPTLPTVNEDGFLFLDVGANMDASPEHLLQYAIMGSVYSEKVSGRENPRVGLLNVGEEPGKGNDLSKKAYELLSSAPVNFIGNVESRDLLNGVCDVAVADGFSGNLILKSIEGTALSMFSIIKEELTKTWFSKLLSGLLYPRLKGIKNKMDYAAYGGACLFGLAAPVIKAHGSSNSHAIFTTIRQARLFVKHGVVPMIEETVSGLQEKKKEEEEDHHE